MAVSQIEAKTDKRAIPLFHSNINGKKCHFIGDKSTVI